MDLEVLTVGTELLLGLTPDTNAAFIAQTCTSHGLHVSRHVTVGDTQDAIVAAMRDALQRVDVVIVTGGLGPTPDDVTRFAASEVADVPLEPDPDTLDAIRGRFEALGRSVVPESNEVQALVPRGAVVLPNEHGTAPGLWLQTSGGTLILLPGVPVEMQRLLQDLVIPRLLAIEAPGASADRVVRSLTVRTTGIAESSLVTSVPGPGDLPKGVALAFLPGPCGVDLRLTAGPGRPPDVDSLLERAATQIEGAVGMHCYGRQREDLAHIVLSLLEARGMRLSVAESCTGGLIGARLTNIDGASRTFVGGVVAYANASKERDLGVPGGTLERYGAVSEEVVRAMMDGVRARFDTEASIAVSGVAGPTGGTPEKPVGTVCFGATVGDAARVFTRRLPGDRQEIRLRAAQAALDVCRRLLLDGSQGRYLA